MGPDLALRRRAAPSLEPSAPRMGTDVILHRLRAEHFGAQLRREKVVDRGQAAAAEHRERGGVARGDLAACVCDKKPFGHERRERGELLFKDRGVARVGIFNEHGQKVGKIDHDALEVVHLLGDAVVRALGERGKRQNADGCAVDDDAL